MHKRGSIPQLENKTELPKNPSWPSTPPSPPGAVCVLHPHSFSAGPHPLLSPWWPQTFLPAALPTSLHFLQFRALSMAPVSTAGAGGWPVISLLLSWQEGDTKYCFFATPSWETIFGASKYIFSPHSSSKSRRHKHWKSATRFVHPFLLLLIKDHNGLGMYLDRFSYRFYIQQTVLISLRF